MPKVSRDSATQGGEFGPVVDRSDQIEGYAVNFTSFRDDIDATPLLKGLPDDRCQCPHWGYVANGKLTFRYANREEVLDTVSRDYPTPPATKMRRTPITAPFCASSLADASTERRKPMAITELNQEMHEAGAVTTPQPSLRVTVSAETSAWPMQCLAAARDFSE